MMLFLFLQSFLKEDVCVICGSMIQVNNKMMMERKTAAMNCLQVADARE
jgi:hypothetical protein